MTEAAEKLKPLLAALPPEDRTALLDYLIGLRDAEADEELTPEEWEAAWLEEATRRLEDMRSGKTVGVPAAEVMRRLQEKYG